MQDIIISEKKLEDYIYSYLTKEAYSVNLEDHFEPGGYIIKRQFNIMPYGIIDIITFRVSENGAIAVVIYELKKDLINSKSLIQVLRYKTGIFRLFSEELKLNLQLKDIKCVLIGGQISKEDHFELSPLAAGVNAYTYDIDMVSGLDLVDCNGYGYFDHDLQKSVTKTAVCLDYKSCDNLKGYTDNEPF